MPILQIRDLPDDLYTRLRNSAERNHRSISQQAIVELRKAQELDATARHEVLDRLRAGGGRVVKKRLPAPETLIRADRDR